MLVPKPKKVSVWKFNYRLFSLCSCSSLASFPFVSCIAMGFCSLVFGARRGRLPVFEVREEAHVLPFLVSGICGGSSFG